MGDPFLNLRQIATPKGSPQPGGNLLYFKSDGKLYTKNSSGVETAVETALGDVTLAGAQTLTNKDLTSATNTFPTSLVTLTGAQVLTNKTITSATFLAGTLTQLPLIRCTSGTRPAHNEAQVIYETDTELMYVSDGANWRVILSEVTGWTAVTYTNSWVDFGAPYQTLQYKKIGNRVFLRGTTKNGTVGAGTPVFTLPAGFRPPSNLILSIASAGGFGQIEIGTTGTVAVTVGSNLSANLNNIDFEVA